MVGCILAKTLLIIGAGPEQVPAYQIAKKRNLTIVGTDIKNNAPGLKLADFSINASTRDPVKTLSEIQNLGLFEDISQSITLIEWPQKIKPKPKKVRSYRK